MAIVRTERYREKMGLNLHELSLDLKPSAYIPKTISDFLREVSITKQSSEKLSKLDDYIKQLEDESRKIDAFKRELPLCMFLLNDAITKLKDEAKRCTKSVDQPIPEEFLPLKSNSDEVGEVRTGIDCSDKKNWMRTVQLWSSNDKQNTVLDQNLRSEEDDDSSVTEDPLRLCKVRNRGGAFVPFKGSTGFPARVFEEDKEIVPVPDLSLMTPIAGNINSKIGLLTDQMKLTCNPQQQQQPFQPSGRKQRRCWSPELHRRFLNALQELGGSQAATPKQIRELMQVDGLTNDEVKSHLQKYRLHGRRAPTASAAIANALCAGKGQFGGVVPKGNSSKSSSPQGSLHTAGSAKGISTTSMEEEEDEKSEGRSWKCQLQKRGEVDV